VSHVFHPGHHELHGITVVLETNSRETFVGRFDSEDERGVRMLDVGIHDGDGSTKEEYIRRSLKYGIRTDRKEMVVPKEAVVRIRRLADFES
jgi:hypothetical protein